VFELAIEVPDATPYSAKDVISATVLSHLAKLPLMEPIAHRDGGTQWRPIAQ
jgi:hypothetical protein